MGRLGHHLEFAGTRPEKQYDTAPELRALNGDWHAVTEVKTGRTTSTIARKDLDQAGGGLRWDRKQSPSVTSRPVRIHPSGDCDGRGTPVRACGR